MKNEHDALRSLAKTLIEANFYGTKEEYDAAHKSYLAASGPEQSIELLDAMDVQAQRIAELKELQSTDLRVATALFSEIDRLHTAREALHAELERYREKYTDTYGALDDAARENTKLRAELDAIRAQELVWHEGKPPFPQNNEWFIAKTIYGDKVVLTALPKEYTYDYKTADETYMLAKNIAQWMQFPDCEYLPPDAPVAPAQQPDVNAELVEAFGKLYKKYVNLLESGHDRIIELGGTCDPVDAMEMSDPGLRDARTALSNAKAQQKATS